MEKEFSFSDGESWTQANISLNLHVPQKIVRCHERKSIHLNDPDSSLFPNNAHEFDQSEYNERYNFNQW